ncbi:hypothetical protein RHSIM_RhsimUnG0078800 [Rhododendron simsii]|uniref:Uncharacterized protein n=1 Tax=Rhododendron simsii TaxID=118357 RepID=A0A834L595_RHOSS|nr:hypothetical protein RHSIM_RhsimUnG0078800 [Rhododendron simsii]
MPTITTTAVPQTSVPSMPAIIPEILPHHPLLSLPPFHTLSSSPCRKDSKSQTKTNTPDSSGKSTTKSKKKTRTLQSENNHRLSGCACSSLETSAGRTAVMDLRSTKAIGGGSGVRG